MRGWRKTPSQLAATLASRGGEIAVTADHLGYAHVTCSEHIAVPVGVAAERSS